MDIPLKPVRDFIQDFHLAFKTGAVYDLQQFYDRDWKDVTKSFFMNDPWPTAREIAPWVKDDRAFLVLYRVLFYNHALTTLRATRSKESTFATFTEAWNAYREFLEFVQEDPAANAVLLPTGWVYDTFSELVYHYQVYHDELLKFYGITTVEAPADGEDAALARPTAELGGATEADLAKAWGTADVLAQLHKLVEKSDIVGFLGTGKQPTTLKEMAGYYALVTLVRFYTKLGDYAAALEASKPLNVFASDGTLFSRLPRAHATLQYYVSFALIMSRRYDDALRVLNKTLTWCQRQYTVFGDRGSESNVPATVRRNGEKMLALAALCHAMVPGVFVDELVRRPLRDRFLNAMEKITAGNGAAEVENLFNSAAPGYFSWSAVPITPEDRAVYVDAKSILSVHFSALVDDVMQRTTNVQALRSYMRLYTNIDLAKLSTHTGMEVNDARSALTSMKLKSWSTPVEAGASSVDPVHFFLSGSTVVVEETKQAFNINGFFIRGIDSMVRLSTEAARPYRHRHGDGAGGAGSRKYAARS